jgi:hypothetical protein
MEASAPLRVLAHWSRLGGPTPTMTIQSSVALARAASLDRGRDRGDLHLVQRRALASRVDRASKVSLRQFS